MTVNDNEIMNETDERVWPEDYEGDVPFGYEIVIVEVIRGTTQEVRHIKQLQKCNWTPEERIQHRIVYLRNKLIDGIITEEEKEELKLLIG